MQPNNENDDNDDEMHAPFYIHTDNRHEHSDHLIARRSLNWTSFGPSAIENLPLCRLMNLYRGYTLHWQAHKIFVLKQK